MSARDHSPIEQDWVRDYCDQFMRIAAELPPSPFRDAVLRRVECVQDLVEAWQKRHWPVEERHT